MMRVVDYGRDTFRAPCVLLLGYFDGVHVGHRRLIACAKEIAAQRGLSVGIMTFYGGKKGGQIFDFDERVHIFESLGLDFVYAARFDDAFIRDIIQEIENNIQNSDFKIEDLADTQHISRTVFYRKIKSLTGSSPIDLVQEIRIKKAIDFLQKGNLRVSEIAYRCGFSSPQYFSRVFKEKTGQSPTEYKGGKND